MALCSCKLLQQCPKQQGLVSLSSGMSYISIKNIPGMQEALWHRGDRSCTCHSAHLQGRELDQLTPSEIKLALQHNAFDPRYTKAGRSTACFPAEQSTSGLNLTQKLESNL